MQLRASRDSRRSSSASSLCCFQATSNLHRRTSASWFIQWDGVQNLRCCTALSCSQLMGFFFFCFFNLRLFQNCKILVDYTKTLAKFVCQRIGEKQEYFRRNLAFKGMFSFPKALNPVPSAINYLCMHDHSTADSLFVSFVEKTERSITHLKCLPFATA